MIERVAAAIGKSIWGGEVVPQGGRGKAARAAIAAMREPTKAMLDAGWEAPPDVGLDGPLSESMRSSWCAMIDAALSES